MSRLDVHQFMCRSDNFGVLIHDPDTGLTASIDAPDAGAVRRALADKGWRLSHILVTHHHADHTEGIAALKSETGCKVIGPKAEAAKIQGLDEVVAEGEHVHVRRAPRRRPRYAGPYRRSYQPRHPRSENGVRRRHAVRDGLRPHHRGRPADDVDLAAEDREAAGRHGTLLRARVHGREREVRADDRARQRQARRPHRRGRRHARARPAHPADAGRHRTRDQPVPAPPSPPSASASAWPARRTGKCSPKSASARTAVECSSLSNGRAPCRPSSTRTRRRAGTRHDQPIGSPLPGWTPRAQPPRTPMKARAATS